MKNTSLFAAGFSYQFGMPLAEDLTKTLYALFDEDILNNFVDVLARTSPYGEDRPVNKDAINRAFQVVLEHKKKGTKNYEQVISEVERLTYTSGFSTTSDQDSYHLVHSILYGFIHSILVTYQEITFPLYSLYKAPYENFKDLLSQDNETWVFTLNHDLFFEFLAIDYDLPLTYGDQSLISFRKDNRDGFNTFINFSFSQADEITIENNKFYKNEYGVNLVKLHGGLNELSYKNKKLFCNLSLDVKSSEELFENFKNMMSMKYYFPNNEVGRASKEWLITNMDGDFDIASKSMLTGGNKYQPTLSNKNGEQKLSLFSDVLKDTDLLTIVGYGFGDKHINNRIIQALFQNDNLKVKLVSPDQKCPECLEPFDENSRIKRILSDVANWLYYEKHQTWSKELHQSKYVETNRKFRELIHEAILRKFSIKQSSDRVYPKVTI